MRNTMALEPRRGIIRSPELLYQWFSEENVFVLVPNQGLRHENFDTTRMHSSRMRADRRLTVSWLIQEGGVWMPNPPDHTFP